jgi:hypothetical protein
MRSITVRFQRMHVKHGGQTNAVHSQDTDGAIVVRSYVVSIFM